MATDHKFKVKNGLHTQNIEFVDSNNTHSITASMLTSDTLSFSGNAGQLFSLTDSMSGTIFSVNDVSGIPSIEVDDDGTIYLAETSGNILIGTGTDDGSTKLQVDGSIKVTGFTTSGQLDVGTQNIKIGNNYIYASGNSNSIHVNAIDGFIPHSTTTADNADLGTSGYRWKTIYGGLINGTSFALSNGWTISEQSGGYARFSSWVNFEGQGFYTNTAFYVDLDSSSSKFAVRGTSNQELFKIDVGNGNKGTFNTSVDVTGVVTVTGNNWYQFGPGSMGASVGSYGMGNKNSSSARQLTFHVPNIAAYSNSGTIPSFGWYSNGSDNLMTLESASGDLAAKGTLELQKDETATGDVLSLYGNRLGTTTMYGFGLNNATLYHKAHTRHQFYNGTNYDNSSYDVQIDSNHLQLNDIGLKVTSLEVLDTSRNLKNLGDITANGNAFVFGSGSQIQTQMYLRAQNTAGAPARATAFHFEGYESRSQGLFFRDTGLANEEWFAGIPYSSQFNRFAIGHHSTTGTKQSEYNANELFSVDTDNNVRIDNTIFLSSSSTYHQIRDKDGNTAIYLGGSSDNRNYYDSAHHRWRTDNGAVNLGEWSQTGLHIGGITTPSEKLEVTGNASIGDASNIAMSSVSDGQLKIKGYGYTGAIALDGSAMHIYHNSNSRSLVLGTNETARLTISGTGGATFSSSLTVNSNFLLYSTGNNDAYLNADARDSGNGARMHRFNRDNTNSAYLPYYENWYDGDSYHSIGVESNRWKFNAGVDVDGTLDVHGNITFTSISQNAYIGLVPETDQNLMLGTGSGSEPRIYLKGTGNGQSDAGDLFLAAGSGGTLIFQSAPTSAGTMTIQNSSPVLILDDNDATNNTNQTGYISYKKNGVETGYVGYGSSTTDLFYVAGVANVTLRAGGVNQIIASSTGVTIAGDLTVNGTTTTIDTTNLNVEDNNITINYGSGNTNASADGAGITIQDAVSSGVDASMSWDAPTDTFNFSHGVNVVGALTSDSLVVDGTAVFDTDTGSSPLQLNRLGTSTNHNQHLKIWVDDGNAVFSSEQDESGRYGGFQFIGRHNGANRVRYLIDNTGGDHYWYAANGNSDMHYDATNRRLGIGVISPSYTLDVAGTINTSSHGDSSQWNTAYGWGNHASAGYITGVTAGAGLTGGGSAGAVTVAMDWTTSDTFTGTYGIVWNASNVPYTASWLQVRGSDDTLLTRNITATGNIISDGLEVQDGAGLRLKGGNRSDIIEGTYYNWFQTGAGTDTSTWWKVCDVTIGTGLYKALAMHIRLKSQPGNYGSTEHVVFSDYTALFPRSGSTQDDAGTPRLSGYDTVNHELRIYKTGNGVYELQSRMKVNYRDLIAEIQVLSTNGGSVTVPSSGTAGTTSGGTAYTAAAPTINSSPEYYMGKTKVSELKQGDNTIVDTIGRIYAGNNGSISSPSISRGTDPDTGFYFPVGNEIGIVTGGAEQARIVSNSFKIGNAGADTDARLAVHGTTTSPNLSSTTPSGYTAVFGNSDVAYGTLFATDGTGRGYIQQRRTNNATTYPLVLQPHGSGVAFNTGTSTPNHFYDFVLPSSGDNLVVRESGSTFTPAGTALTGLAIRNTGSSASYSIFEAQTNSGTAFQIRNNGDARILNNTFIGNGLYVNNTLVIDSLRNIKLPNGGLAGPSLRFYVDENTGIFRQYEGVVSFASDGTNVLDVGKYLKQPYGYTFQFPASTQGWRKLAKIDSRGGGRLVISFTGGNFAPNTYVIDYFKNWSSTCNLKLEQYGTETYITKARLRTDSSDSKIYLEIYLNNTSSNSDNSILVFDQRLLGYNSTTTVYTGALSAGSSSGTTHSEMDFLPQGSTFNKVNVEEETTLDSTLTVGGQSTLARPVLVNGANDNSGRADFSVDTGGSPQVSLHGTQVQIGASDMNWNSKFVYDGATKLAAWDNDINIFSQGSNTGSASGRDIIFSPQTSGTAAATERMRIKGATGRVGIGVSNPQYLLHLNGGATRTDVQVTLDGYGEGASDGAQFGIQTQGAYIWNYENTDLYFATNNTRRLTIDEDGQVGIGTSSPSAVLSLIDPDLTTTGEGLAGLRVHRPNAASQYGYVDYDYGGGGINIGSLYSGGGNSVYGTFHFRQHNAAGSQTAMFIGNTGNVGIGTSNPSKKLHINTTDNEAIFLEGTNGIWMDMQVSGGDKHSIGAQTTGMGIYNRTESAYRMFITDAGAFGIGTQSPTSRLHVNYEVNASVANLAEVDNYSAVRFGSFRADNDDNLYFMSIGGGKVGVQARDSSASGVARILSLNPYGGTVGIGTSSPNSGSKLDVAGSVRITSAASDQTNSADSTTIPATSGADVLRLQGGYTNGTYTTEIAKIDRVGNLPLYIRESRGTANSFTNLMRIGGHARADGGYTAEVFGDLKVAGDILSTGNEHYFVSTNNYIEVDQNTGTKFRFNLNGAKQAELIRISGAAGQFAVEQYSTGSTADGYPAFTEMDDTDTGVYFNGDNQVGFTTGGISRLICQNSNDVIIGGYPSYNHYNSTSSARLSFGGGNDFNNYSIGTSMENYGGNYTKLDLRWHTGIRIGAQSQYGGIRVFDSEDFGNILVSFGKGDGNTRIERNSLIHEHTSTANAIIINRDVGGNITLGNDATYGSHNAGTNRYVTLGFGGNANGSNRIFASNGNGDGMYFAAATNRGFYWRTNGGSSNQMTLTPAGSLGLGTSSPQKILDVVSPNNDFVSFARTISTSNWTGIHFGYREENNSYRKSAIVFERTDLTENNAQGKVHILNGPQSGAGNCTLSDAALTIRENGAVVLPKSVLEFENGSNTITASMLSSDTLSFSGDSGQLFSLTDSMSGTIFSVNDVSGIPSIEVEDDGTIYLAESTGNVLIGTGTDNGNDKLQLTGDATVTGHVGVDVAANASYSLYVGGHIAQSAGSIYAFGDVVIGNGELKRGTTTLINSSRQMTNLTFSGGSTGVLFARDTDLQDTGNVKRLRFNSSGSSVYNSTGGHFFQHGGANKAEIQTDGDAIFAGNVTAYGSPSDINLKENIEVIPNAVEKVQKLDGITFDYKKDGGRSTGLIAQQLQEVLPEVVYTAKDLEGKEHLAVRYGNVVGLLVEAIKEQQTQLTAQQEQINQLTTLVNKLMEK